MRHTPIKKLQYLTLLLLSIFITEYTYANDWNALTHISHLGDFDGDGYDDMLIQARATTHLNGLMKGNGDGTFSEEYQSWNQNFLGINWDDDVSEILIGDFDGNGTDDIFVRSLANGAHKILLSDSAGKFFTVNQTIATNALGQNWKSTDATIHVADFNNDLRADVILQANGSSGSNAIVTADSTGQLTTVQQSWATNYLGIDWTKPYHNIITGDFNGDGFADLFLQARMIIIFVPSGDGSFMPVPILPKMGSVLLLADTGTGQFTNITQSWQNGELLGLDLDDTNFKIYAADFNGDGSDDLFLQALTTGNSYVLRSDSLGSFTKDQTLASNSLAANWTENNTTLLIGNIDNTYGADIIAQPNNASGVARLALTDSAGQLTTTTSVPLTSVSHKNVQYIVGATQSEFNVGPNGAANYTVPIIIPPGVSGVQPELAINYSSQGGNGLLGMGWSLSGLSGITRCGKTYAQDGIAAGLKLNLTDNLCMDGQRLVLVAGVHGQAGAEYKTEQDSFAKIFIRGSGNINSTSAWFEVETKSGQLHQYGNGQSSTYAVGATSIPILWAVNRITDRVGNYMLFHYTTDSVANSQRITKIDYTHNDSAPVDTTALRSVNFAYENRADIIYGYDPSGAPTKQDKRLKTITTMLGGSEKVREYTLTYNSTVSNSDGVFNKSRLEDIQECGSDGKCFSPLKLSWPNDPGLKLQTPQPLLPNFFGYDADSGSWTSTDYIRTMADVNGDGMADIVGFGKDGVYVAYSTGNGFTTPSTTPDIADFGTDKGWATDKYPRQVVDVNGDGMADIVGFGSAGVKVYYSTGNGFIASTQTFPYFGYNQGWTSVKYHPRYIADVYGDGLADIVGLGKAGTYVAYSQGNNGFKTPEPVFPFFGTNQGWQPIFVRNPVTGQLNAAYILIARRVVDVNGDGMADIVGMNAAGIHVSYATENGFTNPVVLHKGYFSNWPETELINLTDISGDGLADIVAFDSSGGVHVSYSTGKGFTAPGRVLVQNGYDQSWTVVNTPRMAVDVNGDGMADIVGFAKTGVQVFYSTGNGFTTPANDTIAQFGYNQGWRVNTSPRTIADVDGDGKVDIVGFSNKGPKVSFNQDFQHNLITQFEDSLGAKTTINYQPLTNDAVYTKAPSFYGFSSEKCPGYPILCLEAPLKVVYKYSAANGLLDAQGSDSYATYTYTYKDLRLHLRGRGLLGFSGTTVTDNQTNIRVVTDYDNSTSENFVDGTWPDRYPHAGRVRSIFTYNGNSNSQWLSITTASFAHTDTAAGVYFTYVQSKTEQEFTLSNAPLSSSTTTNTYADNWGNINTITKVTTDQSGGEYNGYNYTTTTTNTYGTTENERRFGRLSQSVVTKTAPTKKNGVISYTSSSRTSNFEYDATTLLLTAEITNPNQSKYYLRKDYTYDDYGNKIAVKTSGSSKVLKDITYSIPTTTTLSDYNGTLWSRYPVLTTINTLGHSETKTLDAATGNTLDLTGPNNIRTSWTYDGMGRKSGEQRADGGTSSISYNWCGFDCTTTGVYAITTTSSGKQPVKNITDKLGREVRKITYGYDGSPIYKDAVYDDKGKVEKATDPYYPGESIAWTLYEYDVLGRVTKETNADFSETNILYEGLKDTTTNANGQDSIKIKDVWGRVIKVTDDNSQSNSYAYDVYGKLTEVVDAVGNRSTMSYDPNGNKIAMSDPDMGNWTYQYDTLGKLRFQVDAKLQTTRNSYDALGRLRSRTTNEGVSNWYYEASNAKGTPVEPNAVGKLVYVTGPNGYTRHQSYDTLGRPSITTTVIDGNTLVKSIAYDTSVAYTRVKSINYPGGFSVTNVYNTFGFLKEVRNPINNALYWRADSYNARGSLTRESLGNNITSYRSYNAKTGRLELIVSNTTLSVVQQNSYTFDQLGNLTNRTNEILGISEDFNYDSLNRLDDSTVAGQATVDYNYDAIGNITTKGNLGTFSYGANGAGAHAVTSVGTINYTYDNNGSMTGGDGRTIAYTSFNKPMTVTKSYNDGSGQVTVTNIYDYDPDNNRIKKVYNRNGVITTTLYLGKSYEKIIKPTGVVEDKYYISAGNTTIVHTKRSNNTTETRYLLKDHLGSTDVITDQNGAVVKNQSFDAWGARRNTTNWNTITNWSAYMITLGSTDYLTTRGYTGHEHEDELGLINMNARLYDAKLGRFLQADSVVQFPYSTQGLNRYTYVNNNPLSFTDPSGNFLKKLFKKIKRFFKKYGRVILSLALNIIIPGVGIWGAMLKGFLTGVILGGDLKSGIIGALTAGAFNLVGTGIDQGMFGGEFGQAIAHGVVGGVSNVARGGKFAHGFLSGAFTKAFAGKIKAFAEGVKGVSQDFVRVVASAVVGGTASRLGGGKFANGAVTGAFSFLFNERVHEITKKGGLAQVMDGLTDMDEVLDLMRKIELATPEQLQAMFPDLQNTHINDIKGFVRLELIQELRVIGINSFRMVGRGSVNIASDAIVGLSIDAAAGVLGVPARIIGLIDLAFMAGDIPATQQVRRRVIDRVRDR